MTPQDLRRLGVIGAIDLHLAEWLARRGATLLEQVASAVASRAVREGHVCADLDALSGPVLDTDGAVVPGLRWPDWGPLAASTHVGTGRDASQPLVLEQHRLYLSRYHDHEEALARSLSERLGTVAVDEVALVDGLRKLFQPASPFDGDQQRACRVAAGHRLCVVTGGPGTGKTTTVARLLALLAQQRRRRGQEGRVALLAPTGKAAARLAEALVAERGKMPESMRVDLPDRARTVHRALAAIGGSRTAFRHSAASPLPEDIVVVDEASMVDLALMRRLVESVRPDAHLVLLGDRHQLASVESGAVLGEIAGAAERHPASALAACVVTLRHSFRFEGSRGIGALADAIRGGDVPRALEVLQQDDGARLLPRGVAHRLDDEVAEAVTGGFRGLVHATTPEAALAAMGRFRLLCAHRRGPWGVEGLNVAVERLLARQGLGVADGWYAHRPVLVTANDYRQDLFNGDQGVAMPGPRGLRVWFPDASGLRSLPTARLTDIQTVFALSVHKSQGSEFDDVLVVLPPTGSPLLSRELLYTAVTRAKRSVTLVGEPEVVAEAIRQPVHRASGLEHKLV